MPEPVSGNGHGDIQNDPELRALTAELKVLETDILLARAAFARMTGYTFNDLRDMWGVLGYKNLITTTDYRAKYQRGGIAGRIVDALPNATWRGEMELIEDESKDEYTEFEKAWHDFDQRLQVQAKLLRVDKLAGLSTFAVLLIGAPGELDTELPKADGKAGANKILYLTPFAGGGGPGGSAADRMVATGADATIEDYETDAKNKRFGLPKTYRLKRVDLTPSLAKAVHWSRIIHIAEGLLDDEVFGLPRLERVWNLLDDLDKVVGGGAEAFWLRANQGLHVDLDKDMALTDVQKTVDDLKKQAEAYKHQLQRWIRTRGVDIETLGSDVANFASPADAIVTQISGSLGIPKRILTGSEMGELASSQDRDNWKDQIIGRQTQYAGPYIVRQLVDRLIVYGYLPTPGKGPDAYEVKWPHIQTLTETEKSAGAQQWASTNATMGEPVFTEAEIRDKWYGMPPLTDQQRKEIADRKAEAVKQAQAAMQPQQPAAPPDEGVPPQLARAASTYTPEPGDEELVLILAEALDAGNADVVSEIVGLSISPMHMAMDAAYASTEKGFGLCGQEATQLFLTLNKQYVTCVKCLELMRA
jgi:hypothetical protein